MNTGRTEQSHTGLPPKDGLLQVLNVDGGDADAVITSSLTFVRKHLGMEVAYLSEFQGDDFVFRAVSAPGFEDLVQVGGTMPLDRVYCRHILDGRLPELIPDTADQPFAQGIAITHELPIRSHVSVPIRRPDGSPYGMFCCLSRETKSGLNPRDLEVVRAFADLSADQVNTRLSREAEHRETVQLVERVLDQSAFDIAMQPIVDIATGRVAGHEALCRFKPAPYRPPNEWFDLAATVGLSQDLECRVIDRALEFLPALDPDQYISINISPDTLAAGRLVPLLQDVSSGRVQVEVTEHAVIADPDLFAFEAARLRRGGARLAVDDAGAGYSGLQQIIRLRPDVIKLDMSLTRDIDTDPARRSLAAAMVKFAADTAARVVAEGVETRAEFDMLRRLAVSYGQGYYLGRPEIRQPPGLIRSA